MDTLNLSLEDSDLFVISVKVLDVINRLKDKIEINNDDRETIRRFIAFLEYAQNVQGIWSGKQIIAEDALNGSIALEKIISSSQFIHQREKNLKLVFDFIEKNKMLLQKILDNMQNDFSEEEFLSIEKFVSSLKINCIENMATVTDKYRWIE